MHRLALIPGDGIGKEVMPEAVRVVETAGEVFGFEIEWTSLPWGSEYYLEHGRMMAEDGIAILEDFESIFFGAVGAPGVADHITLWGLLLPIRFEFDQYINFRPVRLIRGLTSPLRDKGPEDLDFCVVRENTEGEYTHTGGRIFDHSPREMVVQTGVFTRFGIERVMRYAFEVARSRPRKRLTSATKSNAIAFSMPFWDQIFREIGTEYSDVEADQEHIDAFCAKLVLQPETYDVIVGPNLFADIISDLGPALTGSLGIAASANINPEKTHPSMFEPVHGSAPDIYGRGIANPVGAIWSGAMMIDHLGYPEAAKAIEAAFETVIADRDIKTPDMGGTATTEELARAVAEVVKESK